MRLCALIPKLPDYFIYLGVALEKALYKPGFFFDLGHRGLGSADYVPHALARYAALLGDLAKRKIFVIAEVEILTLLIREQLAVKSNSIERITALFSTAIPPVNVFALQSIASSPLAVKGLFLSLNSS